MAKFWLKIFRLPQTYFLLVGAALGYAFLIIWQGSRPITLIMGGVIVVWMIFAWIWQTKRILADKELNLLDLNEFLEQLQLIENKLLDSSVSNWQNARKWAIKSQNLAHTISEREGVLLPELIETLYTVLDLSNQVAQAIVTREQVQTETYRILTQQHLDSSLNRLQHTHDQLQQLQDQVLLSALNQVNAEIPQRLRGLIIDNKTVLQNISQQSSQNGD